MEVTYIFNYDKCFVSKLIKDYHVKLHMINQYWKNGVYTEIFSIYIDSSDILNKIIVFLKEKNSIENIELMSSQNNLLTVKAEIKNGCCPISNVMKPYILKGKNNPVLERIDYKGNSHWTINVDKCNKMHKIADALKEYDIVDIETRIHRGRKSNTKSMYILKQAYEMGYFDVPKRISLDKLSEELHIPQTSLNLMLRRSLKQLISKHLK